VWLNCPPYRICGYVAIFVSHSVIIIPVINPINLRKIIREWNKSSLKCLQSWVAGAYSNYPSHHKIWSGDQLVFYSFAARLMKELYLGTKAVRWLGSIISWASRMKSLVYVMGVCKIFKDLWATSRARPRIRRLLWFPSKFRLHMYPCITSSGCSTFRASLSTLLP